MCSIVFFFSFLLFFVFCDGRVSSSAPSTVVGLFGIPGDDEQQSTSTKDGHHRWGGSDGIGCRCLRPSWPCPLPPPSPHFPRPVTLGVGERERERLVLRDRGAAIRCVFARAAWLQERGRRREERFVGCCVLLFTLLLHGGRCFYSRKKVYHSGCDF